MNWEYMREEEFAPAIERCGGLCVLPMGCIEKHGQHLPVGCDAIEARGLVEMAAQLEEVVVFPTGMWLGDVTAYHSLEGEMITRNRNRGGIGINPHTLLTVLAELCDEIARNGFRKILIVNSHGGNNYLLEYFIRSQAYRKAPYATMYTRYVDDSVRPEYMYPAVLANREAFPYLTDADMEALEKFSKTGTGGGHADWRETALMYAFCPEHVAADKFEAESGLSTHRADYLAKAGVHLTMGWGSNFPNFFNGFAPIGCSENIGKAMAALATQRLARIFKMLKEDEDCVRMATRQPKEC